MSRNELAAIIWDMDGVLVDTSEFHYQSWKVAYQRYSDEEEPLTRAQFEAVFGMRNDETVPRLFGADVATDVFIEQVSDEKEALFREMIRGRVKPLPGVLSWLSYFLNHGRCQAVASSAPELNVVAIMDELQLAPYFAAVVSGEGAPHLASKPAPDIFLEAAQRLKTPPAQCLVVEDAIVGVQAAKAAGMACLAVTSTHGAGELAAADWIIDDFESLPAEAMLAMWAGRFE